MTKVETHLWCQGLPGFCADHSQTARAGGSASSPKIIELFPAKPADKKANVIFFTIKTLFTYRIFYSFSHF